MQIKVIFIRMVPHLDSLWNRGTRDSEMAYYVPNYITATLFRELKFYKWKIITGGVFNLFL